MWPFGRKRRFEPPEGEPVIPADASSFSLRLDAAEALMAAGLVRDVRQAAFLRTLASHLLRAADCREGVA